MSHLEWQQENKANQQALLGLSRNKGALKKPPVRGAAVAVVQQADLQCAFRALAGNKPL